MRCRVVRRCVRCRRACGRRSGGKRAGAAHHATGGVRAEFPLPLSDALRQEGAACGALLAAGPVLRRLPQEADAVVVHSERKTLRRLLQEAGASPSTAGALRRMSEPSSLTPTRSAIERHLDDLSRLVVVGCAASSAMTATITSLKISLRSNSLAPRRIRQIDSGPRNVAARVRRAELKSVVAVCVTPKILSSRSGPSACRGRDGGCGSLGPGCPSGRRSKPTCIRSSGPANR